MKESKREITKREILEAAKSIVHEKGHEAVTVRNLAQMTGYTHTHLYYYFKDLHALLWSVRLDMIEEMIVELQAQPIHRDDPVDEVIGVFLSYVDYYFNNPHVFRFFYFFPFVKPEGDDRFQQLEQRFQGIWQTTFFRLIQEGVVPVQDLDTIVKTILYALHGMIMLSFSDGNTDPKGKIERELAVIIRHLFKETVEPTKEAIS